MEFPASDDMCGQGKVFVPWEGTPDMPLNVRSGSVADVTATWRVVRFVP